MQPGKAIAKAQPVQRERFVGPHCFGDVNDHSVSPGAVRRCLLLERKTVKCCISQTTQPAEEVRVLVAVIKYLDYIIGQAAAKDCRNISNDAGTAQQQSRST